ncbi:MAG: SpoIIE family protein phosphatase [Chloroflexaceae bacterium]|jgi:sigma-B regulation protein RsbU (phosphoserine phosphatase)|nr:SpoIIE family protein phosphatase [Chloroflexaceae bacterium]
MAPTDAQQRIAELTTLNALAQTLNRAVDLREALDGALAHIVELMGLNTGWIFLKGEGDQYSLAARHNLPPAILYPGPVWNDECDCQELCNGDRLDKAVNMVRCSRLRSAVGDKRGLAQHASVPLRSGDEVLGILNVATTQWGRIAPGELQLLSAAGFLLGTAIARARLYDQVKVRRVQEQGALLSLSQELLVADELEGALQRLARVATRLLEADACAFIEADETDGRALLRAAHGWNTPASSAWPIVLDPHMPHLWYLPERAANLAQESLNELPPLLKRQQFQGHLSVTVEIGGVPVGMLMVNSRSPRQFLSDEAQLLGLLASLLVQTLERERLHQEAMARQKLEQELNLAREIQASFLPDCCPHVPGYHVEAYYRAARQVGGDFYDFIELRDQQDEAAGTPPQRPDRRLEFWRTGKVAPRLEPANVGAAGLSRLGIVIADVTDKGVPAALFMALSRTLLRATASDGRPPASVLEQANRLILTDSRSGLFVTCFYGLLEMATGEFTFANGGHNYPLLYRVATDEVENLRADGIVLGIVPQPRFEQRSLHLNPGDVLLFYTDGVTEAMNPQRELFGDERLTEILRRCHSQSPQAIIDAVLAEVQAFASGQSQSDDITMVVLKRTGE